VNSISEIEKTDIDEGLELVRRIAEEEKGIGRRPTGASRHVIPTIAVIWSLFQISIASWLILDSTLYPGHPSGFCSAGCFPQLSVI